MGRVAVQRFAPVQERAEKWNDGLMGVKSTISQREMPTVDADYIRDGELLNS
jgi:hypothetical protein